MFVVSDFRRVTENEKSKKCHIISGRLGGLGPLDVLTNSTSVIRCQADIQLSCLVEKKKFLFTFTQETCFQVRGWTRVIVKYRLSSCAALFFVLFQIAQIIHEIFDYIEANHFGKQFLMVKLGSHSIFRTPEL